MRLRTKLIGVAVGTAVACGTAAPALADDFVPMGTATVKNVSDIYAGEFGPHHLRLATVAFDYTCHGTAETDHLFIAVKQGPNVQVGDSSDTAVTFYSTNWRSDKGANLLNCNGAKHTMHAVLAPDPYFATVNPPHPALTSGPSFLQICMYDSTGLTMNYSDTQVHAAS